MIGTQKRMRTKGPSFPSITLLHTRLPSSLDGVCICSHSLSGATLNSADVPLEAPKDKKETANKRGLVTRALTVNKKTALVRLGRLSLHSSVSVGFAKGAAAADCQVVVSLPCSDLRLLVQYHRSIADPPLDEHHAFTILARHSAAPVHFAFCWGRKSPGCTRAFLGCQIPRSTQRLTAEKKKQRG